MSPLNVHWLLQLFFSQLLTENNIYNRDFHLHLKKKVCLIILGVAGKVYAPFIIENPCKQYSLIIMHAPGPVETQTQFFKDQNYKTFFLPKVSQWAMIKYAWSSSP